MVCVNDDWPLDEASYRAATAPYHQFVQSTFPKQQQWELCPPTPVVAPAGTKGWPLNVSQAPFPNVVYIKVKKTASSTTAGIARRIGDKHRLSGAYDNEWIQDEPGVRTSS